MNLYKNEFLCPSRYIPQQCSTAYSHEFPRDCQRLFRHRLGAIKVELEAIPSHTGLYRVKPNPLKQEPPTSQPWKEKVHDDEIPQLLLQVTRLVNTRDRSRLDQANQAFHSSKVGLVWEE